MHDVTVPDRPCILEPDCICRDERRADQCEVDDDLDEPPPVHEQRAHERRCFRGRCTVHVGEKAAELHEDGERDQNSGERHARVVEDLVREARQTERG